MKNYGIFIFKEPIKFLKEIQELMNQNAGIIRDEAKLQHGLNKNFGIERGVLFQRQFFKRFQN